MSKSEIEKNLRQSLKDGRLKLVDKNSTFVELWYLREFCNVKILVNGEDHGIGWLKAKLPNPETIRTLWSQIRNEKTNNTEEE